MFYDLIFCVISLTKIWFIRDFLDQYIKVDSHWQPVLFSPGWFQYVHTDWKLQTVHSLLWSIFTLTKLSTTDINAEHLLCRLSSHILAVSNWVQHTAAWLKIESKHLQCFISMTRNHALHSKIALNGTVCVSCISNLLTSHALICYMSDSDSWSGVFIDSQWITVVQDTLLWCGLSVLLTVRCSETWSAAWCVTNYFLWTTVPSSSGIRKKKKLYNFWDTYLYIIFGDCLMLVQSLLNQINSILLMC